MIVVQPRIYVPPEIMKGIASGELVRVGSVVRVTKTGRIFKLLPELAKDRESQETAKAAASGVRRLRSLVDIKDPRQIAGAVIFGAIAAGGILYFATKKRKESDDPGMPDWIREYNFSWSAYLEAIQEGALEIHIIDRLIAALEAIKKHEAEGRVALSFSTEQSEQLVNIVVKYTKELAEANSIELDEMQRADTEHASVVDMRRYLEMQRQIFSEVA